MNTWVSRAKLRMKEIHMTQEILASKMGLTRGAITHYLAGRRQPPLSQFQKLAAVLQTDPAWLQYGTANPTEKTASTAKEKVNSSHTPLPILTWEQAAEFVKAAKLSKDEIKEFVTHFYTDKTEWYALRIKGDSMTASLSQSKSFYEGDIVIVDPDKDAVHGSYVIAVLSRSKEATFKQYVIDGGVRYLKPLNPQYPIVEINQSTHICGVVVARINGF